MYDTNRLLYKVQNEPSNHQVWHEEKQSVLARRKYRLAAKCNIIASCATQSMGLGSATFINLIQNIACAIPHADTVKRHIVVGLCHGFNMKT